MKTKLTFVTVLMLTITVSTSAQKVLYTLKPGERITLEDENRLLSINKSFFHLLFTERGKDKYIIYNGKEYGPFTNIAYSESAPSLLDWAVYKDTLAYQLILDKDQLLGPYETVIDVFRNDNPADPSNDQSHYGFRARKGGRWYVVVDGKEHGPFPEPDGWTPDFSTDGTNWAAPCWDPEQKNYLVVTAKGSFRANGRPYGITFVNNELRINMETPKGTFVYEGDSIKIRHMSGSGSSVKCGTRKINDETYSLYELLDGQGKLMAAANEMYPMARGSNLIVTYAKYTGYTNGQPVEIVDNGSKYPDLWTKGCGYTDIPVMKKLVKEYFVKVNDQVNGPFSTMTLFGGNVGFAPGKSAFIAEPGGVLVVDGKPTTTKGVKWMNYNPITGSMLLSMESGEFFYNKLKLGKFEDAYPELDLVSDQFSINHTIDGKSYVYVSVLKKAIGPFEEVPRIVYSTDKLHWGYVYQRKVYVDGIVKAQEGFDLVYDPAVKAFKWITLKDRSIVMNEYKTL